MKTAPQTYFSVDQTAELTDLRPELIRRWDNEGVFHPSFSTGIKRSPLNRLYSFGDVVTLRTLAQARQYGVQWRELRRIVLFIEEHPETGLSHTTIYVVGRRVFFTYKDANDELHLLSSSPLGQQAMPEILKIEMNEIRKEAADRVSELLERHPSQMGRTESKRFVMSGEEVFAGTRIPVDTIVNLIESGWTDGDILDNYPRLTFSDITLARDRYAKSHRLVNS